MKILVVSDLHLHTWSSFNLNKASELSRRLKEQSDVLEQLTTIVEDEGIESVEIVGDIFHKVGEIPVICLNMFDAFLTTLEELGVPVFITAGNHDLLVRDKPEWFHNATHIFSRYRHKDYVELKIKRVGYSEVFDYDAVKGYDLVFLHKTPLGSTYGGYQFNDGVNWQRLAKDNRLVFFGHIHERQELASNCIVVGSPMHLTFGDIGDRGCYIVDTADWTVDFRKLKYPEFRNVESLEDVKDDYNYYKVKNARGQVSTASNVISVTVPDFFDERLKSDNFDGILREWLQLQKKDETYLELVKDVVSEKFRLSRRVFNGRLVAVTIKDFISIEKVSYKVRPGFTLIKGQNESFSSNGSGKTSLFEAIYWALFGETTKGLTGDDVIRRGFKDAVVELALEDENGLHLIRRSRKAGLSLVSPIESDFNGLRETDKQKAIENLLGFDKNIFLASCYFSQENLVMLTGMSDTEKTNTVTNLLGFEVYDDLYEAVFVKMKGFEEDIQDKEKSQTANVLHLAKLNADAEALGRMFSEAKDEAKRYQNKIIDLQNDIALHQKALNEVVEVETIDYDGMMKELYEMQTIFTNQKDSVEEYLNNYRLKDFEVKSRMNEIKAILNQYKNNEDQLNKEVKNLEELKFGERCDKCGSVISENNVEIFKQDKAQELNAIAEQRRGLEAELSGLGITKDSIDRAIKASDSQREGVLDKLFKVKKDITDAMGEKESYQRKVQEVSRRKGLIEDKIKDAESWIQSYIARIEESDKKSTSLYVEIEAKNKEVEALNKRIEEINWMIDKERKGIEALDFWKVAFSPKGIRVLLLDRFCNEINAVVNTYLSSISGGSMSLVIKPTTVLKSGEERNKLGLDIYMGGVVVKYESLSGGEKRRVDVALCLGLNDWISKKFGLSNGLLGFMVLDEVFSFLDDSGEETIGSLLYQEGFKKAIYVISHTDELQNYVSETWTVSKLNGVSTLQGGQKW